MATTDAIEAYTISLLYHDNQYMLLQRSLSKVFAPGRWTGLGGRVEKDELECLRKSALREVFEESGVSPAQISNFVMRRILLVCRPNQSITALLYFTGSVSALITPVCPEGTIAWIKDDELESLDIIETSQPVLKLMVSDIKEDPEGSYKPKAGLAVFNTNGLFNKVIWAE